MRTNAPQTDAPPRPVSVPLTVRVPPDLLGYLDELVARLTLPGIVPSRADAVRCLIAATRDRERRGEPAFFGGDR